MAESCQLSPPMDNFENGTNGLTNGFSNGTTSDHNKGSSSSKKRSEDRHKSSHRDKDRTKDRHSSSHKSSHKDKHKERDRHRDDKHRHSSSHNKEDRHRSDKSSRDDKDKHRSSEKTHKDGKERHKDDKDRSSKSEKDRSSKSEKDRSSKSDRDRSKSDKDRSRSDNKEHKEKSDKDKHRSSEKSSSSSDKHKHRSSGSHKSSSHHHSSSHKSSHKDKHRDKNREGRVKVETVKTEPMETVGLVKTEEYEPTPMAPPEEVKMEYMDSEEDESKLVIKEEMPKEEEEDEDEYVPLFSARQNAKKEEEDVDYEDDISLIPQHIPKMKVFNDDEDDVPLSARKRSNFEPEEEDDDEDDVPLVSRKKVKKDRKRKKTDDDENDEDFKPAKKRKKEKVHKGTKCLPIAPSPVKASRSKFQSPSKAARKKKEEEENVWKWWEEEKKDDGIKWTYLDHRGPVFAEEYQKLPKSVKFFYKGEHFHLSEDAEEIAGFYARMLDHDYTTKEVFNRNFFKDWRKQMTSKEREHIIDLSKCNFKQLQAFYLQQSEDRKNRTKDEKKALREKNEDIVAEYGWCNIDGHKQKIGNFRIEPPGLFRGRGEHPKQGMLKRRTFPEDVIINCSKDSDVPKPPEGRKWREVRHDNGVSWLACWNENIQGQTKYVMLNAASKLKGEKDWQKYESARRLHKHINKIRASYQIDWKSKEMKIRQRGVALYFIDILALRAGNEKDEDQADTVGCCSLRVEHIELHEEKAGKQYVVVFDFLGKDSIRYYNEITVEKRVFKNLQLFMDNKQTGDDLFDRLNTAILNKYLNELLDGLTAKVFRTYNASRTLQEQLERMTNPNDSVPIQVLTYNRANREVAILCNHQRAIPKTFEKSMANLQQKIDDKRETIHQYEKDMKDLKRAAKHGSVREKDLFEKRKRALEKLREQLAKLEILATDKDENKQIALGTSKLNYLDPRISVAWCKKYDIPIEKVYNKTQRQKFQWAIDMATADYNFTGTPMKMNDTNGGESDEEEE